MSDLSAAPYPVPVTVVRTEADQLAAFGLAGADARPVVIDNTLTMRVMTTPGWHARQLGRALSRFLNAARGGEGDTTYSAGCWARQLAGSRLAVHEVRLVDALNREPGHCLAAWTWHRERGLLAEDGPG